MTSVAAPFLAWAGEGTALFERTLAGLGDAGLDEPSALPGWQRRHVVAHVASNADALVNLLDWARTGIPTPMYASPEQRAADIAKGATSPAGELRERLAAANARLARAFAGLPESAWAAEVRTARGRVVPASEVPWMRVREVWVHAVDLAAGAEFADVPEPVLGALMDDAVAGFSGRADVPRVTLAGADRRWEIGSPADDPVADDPVADDPVIVSGKSADLAAYLLGRPVRGRLDGGADGPPPLPGWL